MSIPALGAVSPTSARVSQQISISGQYIGLPLKIELRLLNGDIIDVGNFGWQETPGTVDQAHLF